MKQPIEYEWKPKFCEKCQKVEHQYGVVTKRKIWKPKPKQVETKQEILVISTTPNEDNSKKNNEDNGENWTKVQKTTRDKGKSITYA